MKMSDHEALSVDIFRQMYKYKPPPPVPLRKRMLKTISCSAATVSSCLPIVKWLPSYSFRNDIVGDLIAGLTVAIMHIPHGLAYAPLAGQMPAVGLYMAVFPGLIYLFLGTSRHISLGTFAVACMMVGKIVSEHATDETTIDSAYNDSVAISYSSEIALNDTAPRGYSQMEVGIAVCFLTGLWQFLLGAFRLGSLWVLLSNSLVSGFTTGAAVHVVTYQIKNLLGVKSANFSGPLKLVYTIVDLVKRVPETNLVTLGLSCCSIFILSSFNEAIKPRIQKRFPKLRVPIPMEFIVIVLGIVTSYTLNLSENHGVRIVKNIPEGLPSPVVPNFNIFPAIYIDCFVLSIVAISISLSLASIFAKKSGYEIDGNQELIAYGACNMFSAFFQCAPCAASLSRSLVQHSVGGKSQIASVFMMLTIIFILLFLGPCFEPVPYGVLSSIVVVTLKGLLWQVKDFPGIWRLSKLDGAVWLVTFCSVVLIDLDYGLGIGLGMSVVCLLLRGQDVQVIRLGKIPSTNLFLDSNSYRNVENSLNVMFLKIIGSLHFGNISSFNNKFINCYKDFKLSNIASTEKSSSVVVLDLGCVPNVDPSAVTGLLSLYKDLKIDDCELFFCDCSDRVYDYLERCKFFELFPKRNFIFSIFDATEFLKDYKNN